MREAGKNFSVENCVPVEDEYPEVNGFENEDFDDDGKKGPRSLRGRGNPKRPGRTEQSMRETCKNKLLSWSNLTSFA